MKINLSILSVLVLGAITIFSTPVLAQQSTADQIKDVVISSLDQSSVTIKSTVIGEDVSPITVIEDGGQRISVSLQGFNLDEDGFTANEVEFIKFGADFYVRHDANVNSDARENLEGDDLAGALLINDSANTWLRLGLTDVDNLLNEAAGQFVSPADTAELNKLLDSLEESVTEGFSSGLLEVLDNVDLTVLLEIPGATTTKSLIKGQRPALGILSSARSGSRPVEELFIVEVDNSTGLLIKVIQVGEEGYFGTSRDITIHEFSYKSNVKIQEPKNAIGIFDFLEAGFNKHFDTDLNGPIEVMDYIADRILQSLNDARASGQDAYLKSNLSNMRSQMEIYYSQNDKSYLGICEMAYIYDRNIICNDSASGWQLYAELSDGSYQCVDSTGLYVTIDNKPNSSLICR